MPQTNPYMPAFLIKAGTIKVKDLNMDGPVTFSSSGPPVRNKETFAKAVGTAPAEPNSNPFTEDSVWTQPGTQRAIRNFGVAPQPSGVYSPPSRTEMKDWYRGSYTPRQFMPYDNPQYGTSSYEQEVQKADSENRRVRSPEEASSLASSYAFLHGESPDIMRAPDFDMDRVSTGIQPGNKNDPFSRIVDAWTQGGGAYPARTPEEQRNFENYFHWSVERLKQPHSNAASQDYNFYDNYNHAASGGFSRDTYQRYLNRFSTPGNQLYAMDYDAANHPVPIYDPSQSPFVGPQASGFYMTRGPTPFIGMPEKPDQQPSREFQTPWFDSRLDADAYFKGPGDLNENLSPLQLLMHELRHHATLAKVRDTEFSDPPTNPDDGRPYGLGNYGEMDNVLYPLLRDNANLKQLSPDEHLDTLRQLKTSTSHGLNPTEQIGWMSGLQQELYRATGSRVENPADARRVLEGLIDDEATFTDQTPIENKEVLRGVRHLRRFRDSIQHIQDPVHREYLTKYYGHLLNVYSHIMPALVRNDSPGQVNPYTSNPRERSSGPGNSGNRWGAIT